MADEEKNETTDETPDEPTAEESPSEETAPEETAPEPTTTEEVEEEAGQVEAEAEPVAEAEPAAVEEPLAEEPQPEKRKRKHVPRPERRQRPKRRVASTERKPIVRLPKPEHERGRRLERRGIVVSAAMDKTIVVRVDAVRAHPKYKKVIRRSQKLHAHDEQNAANVGDVVRIVETRPLSKTKCWRLAEVLEVAK